MCYIVKLGLFKYWQRKAFSNSQRYHQLALGSYSKALGGFLASSTYNTRAYISEKTSFQVGMELKKVHKQGGDEKAVPLSGLKYNALASLVVCFAVQVHVSKWSRELSVLHWRPERGRHNSVSGVGFCEAFSTPPCLCTFSAPSLLKKKFFGETFSS